MLTPLRLPTAMVACAIGTVACATVTVEDPPSRLQPGAGSGGASVASSGAGGSTTSAPAAGGTGGGGGAPAGSLGGASGAGSEPPVNSSGSGGESGAAGSAGQMNVADAAPQFPQGMVLLEETFEAFNGDDWDPSADGVWELTTDPDAEGNVYAQTETTESTPHMLAAGDPSWRDVIVDVDLKVVAFNGTSTSNLAGVCVRVSDAENFYFVGFRSDLRVGGRIFQDGGENLDEASDDNAGEVGVWHHLQVQVIGETISAYFNEELMFTTSDSTHAAGGIGLCTTRTSALFDNVRVTAP